MSITKIYCTYRIFWWILESHTNSREQIFFSYSISGNDNRLFVSNSDKFLNQCAFCLWRAYCSNRKELQRCDCRLFCDICALRRCVWVTVVSCDCVWRSCTATVSDRCALRLWVTVVRCECEWRFCGATVNDSCALRMWVTVVHCECK